APGRPETLQGEVRDALKIAEDAMPQIILKMIDRAQGVEECPANVRQAAAEYLCDRIYGKANQPLSGDKTNPLTIILNPARYDDGKSVGKSEWSE
ncbi:MAG: hypothetical protein PHQ43_12225, partial [Dehalococcoidales bacterium]|nr:hypothetical protein [Dehalococcoidales bacterium]